MEERYPEWPTAGHVLRSLEAKTVKLTEHRYAARSDLERHCHGSSFLTIVLRGAYSEEIQRRSEECRPRSVRFLPAGETHANRYYTDTLCLHLELSHDMLKELGEYANVRPAPGVVSSAAAAAIGARLYRELVSGDDLSALSVQALAVQLLIESCRNAEAPARVPPWLSRVENAVRESFASKPTLPELAALAGVHVAHLCKEFHRHRGCTIGDFVRRLRVERAAELLSGTDLPISNIANSVGCFDQSHLCALFRKKIGVTPRTYRLTFRETSATPPS